jgi:hypothetical protein
MVAGEKIAGLQLRKRELLLESERCRLELQGEWAAFHPLGARVERAKSLVQSSAPLWIMLTPVAGYLAMRKWRQLWKVSMKLGLGWRVARFGWSLYQNWAAMRGRM